MSVIKVIPRANSVLFVYPDGASKTFLLNSYLTASATGNNINVQSSNGEYAIYKFPFTAIRDASNTVYGASAAATVTGLNNVFSVSEVDVATLKSNFEDLDSHALRDTTLITELAGVEKFTASEKGDYLLTVNAATPGGVKTVAPATFISNNSIVTSNSSPTFVTPTITSSLYLDSSSTGIVFEGGTADASETTLRALNPTADRTIYLPNASGTVALVGTNGEASFDAITFDLTPTTADGDGVMRYDPDYESLVFTTANGNKLVLGQTYLPVINKTASTIALGTAVKAVGVEGQRFKIEPFDADVDDGLYFIGLTEKSMAAEAEGVVVSTGYVKGINTSSYTVGTILYASGTAGQLTSTQPAKPAADIVVAMVTTSAANGSVFVRPTVHNMLGDLQDVSVASPTAGVLVQRNSANTLWTKTPYAFPTSDGTNGQVLTTNGSGVVSWGGNNAFTNIAVSGQSNVGADSAGDTLTLVGAGGTTITTDNTSDTITFTSRTLDDNDVALAGNRTIDIEGNDLIIQNTSSDKLIEIQPDAVLTAGLTVRSVYGNTAGAIRLLEAPDNGGFGITLQAPAQLTASTTFILPSADGSAAQVLQTNGSGTLSFASLPSPPNTFGTIAVSGQSNVVADSSTDTLTLAAANTNIVLTTNASNDTVTIGLASFPSVDGMLFGSTGLVSISGDISTGGTVSCANISSTGTSNLSTVVVSTSLTTTGISFTGGGTSTIGPDNSLPTDPPDLLIRSNGNVDVVLDYDDDENSQAFRVKDGDGNTMFSVDEDGISVANGTASTGAVLRLGEATANGTNYVAVQAPASLAGNTTYTLPTADGTSGQVLSTNGSGTLSFVTRKATQVTGKTVATGAWSLVSGVYEASISDSNILSTSIVDVIPDNADAATVRTAQMLPRTDSSAGAVKIYSTNAPTATITFTINIFDL